MNLSLALSSSKPIKTEGAEIWVVGGGKGGIGKSFALSSMGHYLSQKEKKVVLIDADLGGANLHTFLGINRPNKSLNHFFEKKLPLEDLLVNCDSDNLRLLVGAIDSLSIDHIKHTQKTKLFRHIRKLNADYVLIDIGAGAHFNTIDTFLLADKMLVMIVPEITSIENMYFFLKNVFYRKLLHTLGGHGLKHLVQKTWENRIEHQIINLKQLTEFLINGISSSIRDTVRKEIDQFLVYIILNQVRSSQEIMIGNSVKSICKKYFGLNARYVGYIEHDDFICRSINKRQPYVQAYPASRCTKEIERITDNLLEGRYITTKS